MPKLEQCKGLKWIASLDSLVCRHEGALRIVFFAEDKTQISACQHQFWDMGNGVERSFIYRRSLFL
jgi:hypothetical protein